MNIVKLIDDLAVAIQNANTTRQSSVQLPYDLVVDCLEILQQYSTQQQELDSAKYKLIAVKEKLDELMRLKEEMMHELKRIAEEIAVEQNRDIDAA